MNNNKNELIDLEVSNDIVFQRIFGKVGNEPITKGLLEAILNIKIKDLSLDRNKRMQLDTLDDKIGRLDVKAELEDGTIVHIEMQATEYEFMEKRIAYYNDALYTETLARGRKYKNLRKVITILITGYDMECTKGIPKYHTVWHFREKDYPDSILTEDKEIHIIELKKFDKNKEQGKEANWINFIKVKELSDLEEVDKCDEMIRKATEELEMLAGNKEMQEDYFDRKRLLLDTISFLDYNREKGLEEGRKQGIEQGIEQGIKQGKKEGIKEGKKKEKIEIAKKLLKLKMPLEQIVETTGLTKEEIEVLTK